MRQNIPKKLALAFFLLFLFQGLLKGQNKMSSFNSASSTVKIPGSLYVELLGNGLIYSLNYDTRFNNKTDGLGARIGAGYNAHNGNRFFVLPVALNYLAGKNGKYFEMGGGITYYSENTDSLPFVDNSNHAAANGIVGTLTFGYRMQPEDGGYCFRAGVSPIITSTTFAPYWPYVSIGYAF